MSCLKTISLTVTVSHPISQLLHLQRLASYLNGFTDIFWEWNSKTRYDFGCAAVFELEYCSIHWLSDCVLIVTIMQIWQYCFACNLDNIDKNRIQMIARYFSFNFLSTGTPLEVVFHVHTTTKRALWRTIGSKVPRSESKLGFGCEPGNCIKKQLQPLHLRSPRANDFPPIHERRLGDKLSMVLTSCSRPYTWRWIVLIRGVV